jgi:hypothetical protein
MKNTLIIVALLLTFGLSACNQNKQEPKKEMNTAAVGMHAVKVVDNIDAANYTYLKVSENLPNGQAGGNEYWIAVPQMKVEKGETLYYSQGLEMKDFHSKTLNKTFKSIYFVQSVSKTPQTAAVSSAHPGASPASKADVSVEHLKNGYTVAQIFNKKKSLAGKTVMIRGQVTKYNPDIMDKNWIHIQDGTGSDGNYDLLVTSSQTAAVGDIVVVEGTVAVNKDFGAGYSYTVLLENGKIKVESGPKKM